MTSRVAIALLATLCACSSSTPGTEPQPGPCAKSTTPSDTYSAGIVKAGAGGKVRVKLVDALPAPPTRGNNKWSVQLLDPSDKPLATAKITQVKPFMPEHSHGTSTVPVIGAVDASGSATIDKIDLVMPGVWEITITVDVQGASDPAKFAFCIDG
jgi:hypothetical protein